MTLAADICKCGHEAEDHDPYGCLGPANGQFCRCSEGREPEEQAPPTRWKPPIKTSAADLVREAFAIGYAKSTAAQRPPLTERARRACQAAVRVAEASPQPDVNATLQLGQLEGIWAVVYARREALEKLHGKALASVLDAIKNLDWQDVVDRIGRQLLLDPNMSRQQVQAFLGRDIEQLVNTGLAPDDMVAWRAAMNAALIDAQAEGQTAGLALVGDAADITIDWDLAATAAKAALADNQVLWDASSGWMAKQAHGIGYQVSQYLATAWEDEATAEEMQAGIADLLDVGRSTAGLILDQAIGQSLSVGALDTYSQAGVQYADYVTAGDGRVCAACGEAEDDNSYLLADCPQPPLHVGCRCCTSPSDYQPTAAALSLVAPYAQDTSEELEAA